MHTYPWDTPGLPPRAEQERCGRHKHCAYRDDDPARCPICHASHAKCAGRHGGAPADKWSKGVVTSGVHATLKLGQHNDPREAATRRTPPSTRSQCALVAA